MEIGTEAYNDSCLVACPVEWSKIDMYLKVFGPAYLFDIKLQRSDCSIGEVLPSILSLIDKWENMNTTDSGKRLCTYLIDDIKHRFSYEMSCKGMYYWVCKLIN